MCDNFSMNLPRILVLSDLHLEMHDYEPAKEGYDMVVLAGDIHTRERGVEWAKRHFQVPTLYVRGNHEGYGTHWQNNLAKMRKAAEGSCVQVMEKDEIIIHGVRFLGATGWSTFTLWHNRPQAMSAAGEGRGAYSPGMKDYRHIRTAGYRRILPSDTAAWAHETHRWFAEKLSQPHDGPTVCISHHPPIAASLPHGVREPLDAADANDWDDLVASPHLSTWIHGHTHHPVNYRVGHAHIYSNPRGYPGQMLEHDRMGIIVPQLPPHSVPRPPPP